LFENPVNCSNHELAHGSSSSGQPRIVRNPNDSWTISSVPFRQSKQNFRDPTFVLAQNITRHWIHGQIRSPAISSANRIQRLENTRHPAVFPEPSFPGGYRQEPQPRQDAELLQSPRRGRAGAIRLDPCRYHRPRAETIISAANLVSFALQSSENGASVFPGQVSTAAIRRFFLGKPVTWEMRHDDATQPEATIAIRAVRRVSMLGCRQALGLIRREGRSATLCRKRPSAGWCRDRS